MKYKGDFKILTNGGRVVGYSCSIEHAIIIAQNGKNRYIMRWIDGIYKFWKQL